MKRKRQKILAFLFALCLLLSDCGEAGYAALDGGVKRVRRFTASDGSGWRITVLCGKSSAIPPEAELEVSEIPEGGADYDAYTAQAAEALGQAAGSLPFARAFHIALRDPDTGAEYQPDGTAQVRIELLDNALAPYPEVGVVHIPDGDRAELLDSSVRGVAVEFETDSFSVYVVTGDGAVPRLTFTFFVPEGGGDQYVEMELPTEGAESGSSVFRQTIRPGEKPVVPQPDLENFAGWYRRKNSDSSDFVFELEDTPYDFDHIQFTKDNDISLYAVAKNMVTVTFHDQFDSEINGFPIAFTRRGELSESGESDGNGGSDGSGVPTALMRIDDLSTVYSDDTMAFFGWSETPIRTPGAERDVNGDPVRPVSATDGCISVTKNQDLYPIYKPVYWLHYYSAQSGMGASYVPAVSCWYEDGSARGPAQKLPVTSRPGYTFRGWYTGTLDEQGQVVYGVQITDADGTLRQGAGVEEDADVYAAEGYLHLRRNATLYAGWEANYRVIIQKQNTTDALNLPDGEKRYEYVETFYIPAEIGQTVSVPEQYTQFAGGGSSEVMPGYAGYAFAGSQSAVILDSQAEPTKNGEGEIINQSELLIKDEKGIAAFLVRYDRMEAYVPGGETHSLVFADSDTEQPSPMPDAAAGIAYETPLKGFIPADPASVRKSEAGNDVLTFSGWFLDRDCTLPADLESMSMPDHDLTVYAGWKGIKYRVEIDPNYGALYRLENGVFDGTGSTWFNNTYVDDPIAEYKHVTRDYVPSTSGTWYYAKHDMDYYGDGPQGDRYTYYTQNPGQATEDTTFAYAPGIYTYAGWYEMTDGVEADQPYDFSQHTDHPTALRLRWKKQGTLRLAFAPGEGTVAGESEAYLPEDSYTDNAGVTLTAVAVPPAGFLFAGWKVRGDESGKVCAPGQVLTLHADDAVRTGGRDVIFLDAVYTRIPMARIIYDPNGGVVDRDAADFGVPEGKDAAPESDRSFTEEGQPVLSNLRNNSIVTLSSGAGFSLYGAELVGWSDKPVCDGTVYELGSAYGVDTAEPVTLYAAWQVTVTYHLNRDDADWGETPWDDTVYEPGGDGKTRVQRVFLGSVIPEPEGVPAITETGTDTEGIRFRCWTTDPDASDVEPYDFSRPVTGSLDFYAAWSGPIHIPVHAVDASGETLTERADWLASPEKTTLPVVRNIPFTAAQTIDSLNPAFAETVATETNPEREYEFAFAAAHQAADPVTDITESDKIDSVYYSAKNKHIYASFSGTAAPLTENVDEIYFLYYRKKALNIGYKKMNYDGTLEAVSVSGDAPASTGALGTYNMAENAAAPLGWLDGGDYTHFAYAVGREGAASAFDLLVITDTSGGGTSPALNVRNTWRGFQYTVNGTDWISCGFNPQLYVLFFEKQPTILTIGETTIGPRGTVNSAAFQYHVAIQEKTDGAASGAPKTYDITLRSGETHSVTAYYWEDGDGHIHTQTVTVAQTPDEAFTTTVTGPEGTSGSGSGAPGSGGSGTGLNSSETASGSSETGLNSSETASGSSETGQNSSETGSGGSEPADSLTWSYTTASQPDAPAVMFTNSVDTLAVEVHVAMVEADGIVIRDDLRTAEAQSYRFNLARGESEHLGDRADPPAKLPSESLFKPDETHTLDDYAFGAVMYGTRDGSAVTPDSLEVAAVTYGRPAGAPDNICELLLKDSAGTLLGELGGRELYYLYYPMPRIQYVKREDDGTLKPIAGSGDGSHVSETGDITYNRNPVTMNSQPVVQDQRFKIPLSGLVISQTGANFRMPPNLDDGVYACYLSYTGIGAGGAGAQSLADIAYSSGKTMRLRIHSNTLQYSLTGSDWHDLPMASIPTIYAVYTERGYNLQISKTVEVPADYLTDGGDGAFFTGNTFSVDIASPAITRESYAAEGLDDASVSAEPAAGGQPGHIRLTVADGAKLKILGLSQGVYTLTEGGNGNFALTAETGPIVGTLPTPADVTETEEGSRLTLTLDGEKQAKLTNRPVPLCKIVEKITDEEEKEHIFYTLQSAADYAEKNGGGEAVIQMLRDYPMPAGDSLEIPEDMRVTLTTALDGEHQYSGGTAVIRRTEDGKDVPMFVNNGTLELDTIRVDGSGITASQPMIQSAGNLILGQGATLAHAVNAGDGGAVFADAGDITIRGTIDDNSAARGGAVYYKGVGTVRLEEGGILLNNSATQDGGGIYAESGSFVVTDSSAIRLNRADSGSGGGIYARDVVLVVEGNGELTGNRARNGGAVYAERGTITLQNVVKTVGGEGESESGGEGESGTDSGTEVETVTEIPAVKDNTAAQGNGGAFWLGSGLLTVSGGTMERNHADSAEGGKGGAVYVDSATVNLSDSASMQDNTAVNGAAIFVDTGIGNLSGGVITGNTASNGGAVGMGTDTVKLNFSGSIQVTGNEMNGEASNVYLDQDTDTVLNAAGLTNGAVIGVYVPMEPADLFHSRGIASAKFGSYSLLVGQTADKANLSVFKNDHSEKLTARAYELTKKIVWGNPIAVEIHYVDNFNGYPDGFPPKVKNSKPTTIDPYFPPDGINKISQIADNLLTTQKLSLNAQAAYAGAFATDAALYGEYITDVNWDSEGNDGAGWWKLVKRDGSVSANHDKLIIYYALPAFLSIENNTNHTLSLSDLQVLGTSVDTGYGYVMAVNGATLHALRPIGPEDLSLGPYQSRKLLFPGARSKSYSISGSFNAPAGSEPIPVRQTGAADSVVGPDNFNVGLSGTLRNDGTTISIIFGEDKKICRIVDKNKEEHLYTSISEAVEDVAVLSSSELLETAYTAEIGMLSDYLMPGSDEVIVPEGYHITLNTAIGGDHCYSHNPEVRATISRDSGNSNPFLRTANYPVDEKGSRIKDPKALAEIAIVPSNCGVTLENLIFDGKDVASGADGGVLQTYACEIQIKNIDCQNFTSNNGGAVFGIQGTITIENSNFRNCDCRATADKGGGGAVWTTATLLTMSDCTFDNCVCSVTSGTNTQGGAVFHNITNVNGAGSVSVIERCTFENCHTTASAGALESDARDVTVRDCTFRNCYSSNKNAGALNIYTNNSTNLSSIQSTVLVENCGFYDCKAGAEYGGAIRSLSKYLTVKNCTIRNCQAAKSGGAIAVTHDSAVKLEILGCTIDGCISTGEFSGGGVYSQALTLVIGDYQDPANEDAEPVHTTINNCESAAKRGGGIYHSRNNANANVTITNATISNCKAKTDGGGLFTLSTGSVTLTGTTIRGCVSRGKTDDIGGGGGICVFNQATLKLDGCTVTGSSAANLGGGVYARGNVVLCGGTVVTGNRLTTNEKANAAGVYIFDGKTLTVGTVGKKSDDTAFTDTVTVKDNYTASGARSNLRLRETNGVNDTNSVKVLCHLQGEIFVINAKRLGTQFGTSDVKNPVGFSDIDPVFKADDDSVWGIIDRSDQNGKKIIWGGPPVCKITDKDGNLLFFKGGGTGDGTDPAIFDRLDAQNATDGSRTTAFSFLREPTLYNQDGSKYEEKTFVVKMLVDYEQVWPVKTPNSAEVKILLTTETSRYNKTTNLYGYRGRAGTSAVIRRGSAFPEDESQFLAQCGLTLRTITLDGGGVSTSADGVLLKTQRDSAELEIGSGATLRNAATSGDGGAVYAGAGVVRINGGVVRNCTAENGGAAYLNGGGTHELTAGSIDQCWSTQDGGGVYVNGGTFQMSGGTISRCGYRNGSYATENGGGVFVSDGQTMEMSGGSITNCGAQSRGGGIAAGVTAEGSQGAKIQFSRRPTVSGNKSAASVAANSVCNVQLDEDTNLIINTCGGGLFAGAVIGVYVSGEDTGADEYTAHADDASVYYNHGIRNAPFGTFEDGDDVSALYGFVNDRNGLKGGLISDPAPNTIYWVKIYTLTISKEVQFSENIPNAEKVKMTQQVFHYKVRLFGTSENGIPAKDIHGLYGEMNFHSNWQDSSTADVDVRYDAATQSWLPVSAENLPKGLRYEVSEELNAGQNEKCLSIPLTNNPGQSKAEQAVLGGIIGENSERGDIDKAEKYVSRAMFRNVFPVCKITDKNGNPLYREETYWTAQHTEVTVRVPAVYTELTGAVEAWRNAAATPLYNGSGVPVYNISEGKIEMLVPNYTLTEPLTVESGKMTLTTAKKNGAFPFQGSGAAAVVRRGQSGDTAFTQSMLTVSVKTGAETGTELHLNNITLDGAKGANYKASSPGGIVNVANRATLEIQENAALQNSYSTQQGGAVYVESGGKAVMSGGTVNFNESGGDGAGIYLAEGSELRLSGKVDFGGTDTNASGSIILGRNGNFKNPAISGAKNGGSSYTKPRQDIFIAGYEGGAGDTNAASLVVAGNLTADRGTIWVWAQKMPHYRTLEQFAKIDNGVTVSAPSLAAFRNARPDSDTGSGGSSYLYGVQKDRFVHWSGQIVCQITDKDRNLLYYKAGDDYLEAVFGKLSDAFDSVNRDENGNVSAHGNVYSRSTLSGGEYQYTQVNADENELRVEMLVSNYKMKTPITLNEGKTVTLTTADRYEGKYVYTADQNAVIERTADMGDNSMFTVQGAAAGEETPAVHGDLRLTEITLDGAKTACTAKADGGIVSVEQYGVLEILDGAALQNSRTTKNGGAVYVAEGGRTVMSGGAVSGCVSEGDGAAIYLAQGSVLELSGKPDFSNSVVGGWNRRSGGEVTNGGTKYAPPRQDIFVAGYEGQETSAVSLVVAGEITSGDGSVWVWAEKDPHYKSLEQFAVIADGVDAAAVAASLKAFRNAQDDGPTEAGSTGSWLYGTNDPEEKGEPDKLVYWNGSRAFRKVILRKVDGQNYKPLAGAKFTIKRSGSVVTVDGVKLENLTTGPSGIIWIGVLPYGNDYKLVETSAPDGYSKKTFTFIVDKDGFRVTG